MTDSASLSGKVALVTGATRGAGRGIAVELGALGAIVVCTGRTTRTNRSDLNRAETIEETADLVTAAGGRGIAVRCDHTDEGDVRSLTERIHAQHGGLDILINDVWGGESLSEWGKKAWELDLAKGRTMLERAVLSHVVTARFALPLLKAGALIVEVTDGDTWSYRGNVFYDLAKTGVMRLARIWSWELQEDARAVTSVSVTPGYLRSEEMLTFKGLTEDNWREDSDPNFQESETPRFVGRGIARLAADPDKRRFDGRALASWTLMDEYRFTDVDGRTPHWGKWFARLQAEGSSGE
ncbi:SDR family oxidoreductase [Deinococcus yavapaiensis]|uniref:NAD(P)-dependent dehydrogenase (Short-subunit alcohol dehydrogenase family) n=1 Tax=Deinococcus yavapaiensis KR-236 TaxID=694435 RepID=A0A318SJZ5_9DEIO|nr:SDR family oxidoreductase [Deinococcus yavapaiensis]PYE52878.1 NAD(P)-dependent dehydrogenase (short-subunit alcohol dehydrogenase family) [Deinococcus yavapaiensis KR-236]